MQIPFANYLVERVGINHVGIGSNFNHGGGIEGYADALTILEPPQRMPPDY